MRIVELANDAALAAEIERISTADADSALEQTADSKLNATRTIVDDVRARGDAAVADCTERFDRVRLKPEEFLVSDAEIDSATSQIEPETLKALERAHANIRTFHEKNLRQSWEERDEDGSVVGQRITAIDSVGLYVPGGTAFYPSSVLMNIVPARVAGVRDIAMVSPPSYKGGVHPLVLAAAKIAGATRVYRVGGAQAVAALAYGTDHIAPVLKIAGPGNAYVTLAKRLVSSICDIDKEAGPSEVVVLADDAADVRQVTLELLAQAEHDEDARPMFVTTSRELLQRVLKQIEEELKTLARAAIIRGSIARNGVVYVVSTMDQATLLTTAIAPEHLSIQTRDPRAAFAQIPDVGCAVLGGGTSVAVGDYYAGPNHILPTGRRARFSSPLTAEDFRKVTSIISFSPSRMKAVAGDIIRLANAEELGAHARAVEIRQ